MTDSIARLTVAITVDHDAISDSSGAATRRSSCPTASSARGSGPADPRAPSARHPGDVVHARPHAETFPATQRRSRARRWPRDRLPRLVPRGLLGDPDDEPAAILGRCVAQVREADGHRAPRPPRPVLGPRAGHPRLVEEPASPTTRRSWPTITALSRAPRRSPLPDRTGRRAATKVASSRCRLLGARRLAVLRAGPATGRDALSAPSRVLEIWSEELRYAYDHAPGGLLTVTMHPECIGRGHRMAMLERFIDEAEALDGVVFDRLDAVVGRWSAANP